MNDFPSSIIMRRSARQPSMIYHAYSNNVQGKDTAVHQEASDNTQQLDVPVLLAVKCGMNKNILGLTTTLVFERHSHGQCVHCCMYETIANLAFGLCRGRVDIYPELTVSAHHT